MAADMAKIQQALGGVNYPASKQDLINRVRGAGGDQEVMDALNRLPDQQFNSMTEVTEALGMGEGMA